MHVAKVQKLVPGGLVSEREPTYDKKYMTKSQRG